MIYELCIYIMVFGGVCEYVCIYNECGCVYQVCLLGYLVVMMILESGDFNQLVYYWVFDSLEDCVCCCMVLLVDFDFVEFCKQVCGLLV